MSCVYVTPSFLAVWRTQQVTIVTIVPVIPAPYGKLDFTEESAFIICSLNKVTFL